MQPRQIFVFSPIDSYSAEFIVQQLLSLDRESNEEITMFINSGGGYVTSMFAIIDAMNIVKSPIRTVVMGIAASAAAVIASAGTTRLITNNAQYMLHEVSSFTFGNMSSMQEDMEQAIKQQEKLLNILAKTTKQTTATIKGMITKTDKYFSSQDSVNFGLADKVIQDSEAQILKLSEAVNVEGYEMVADHPEVQLLSEGKFSHPAYGEVLISAKTLDLMKSNFDSRVRGIDISIDYTHDNDTGEKPAAFWIKSLEVRSNKDGKGKGLFAKGEFTPKGLKLISEKEYKYSSADFVVDYVDQNGKHHPYVLRGGTLTNRPFIKGMNPIKLSEYKPVEKELNKMDKDQLINALKIQGVDVTSLLAKETELNAKVLDLENKIKELSALPAQKESEIAELKTKLGEANSQIVLNEKTKIFNSLVSEGKVVPAQKEDIFNTFDSAEKIKNFYANAPKIVATKPTGSEEEGAEENLTEAEQKVVASGDLTREEILANRKVSKKIKK